MRAGARDLQKIAYWKLLHRARALYCVATETSMLNALPEIDAGTPEYG
jgi:hypothetical protein